MTPAVVVPSLLSLSDRGYGVDKGVPTLVIAAASVDDVLAITGFGVLMGIAFSEGNNSFCYPTKMRCNAIKSTMWLCLQELMTQIRLEI